MIPPLPLYLYFGRKFGMNREETLATKLGEMQDLISIDGIMRGVARIKKKKLSFDEALRLR